MIKIITESLDKHRQALEAVSSNSETITQIARLLTSSLKDKGKIIFMGNGGSAADSQHLAAELIGRFKQNRRPLAAIALTTDTSILTAVGNDYGFEEIFTRQIEALANNRDVIVSISTSGKSPNLINTVKKAKQLNIKTVGLLGKDGGDLKNLVDIPLIIPFNDTARIQEMHILAGHIICEIVENELSK